MPTVFVFDRNPEFARRRAADVRRSFQADGDATWRVVATTSRNDLLRAVSELAPGDEPSVALIELLEEDRNIVRRPGLHIIGTIARHHVLRERVAPVAWCTRDHAVLRYDVQHVGGRGFVGGAELAEAMDRAPPSLARAIRDMARRHDARATFQRRLHVFPRREPPDARGQEALALAELARRLGRAEPWQLVALPPLAAGFTGRKTLQVVREDMPGVALNETSVSRFSTRLRVRSGASCVTHAAQQVLDELTPWILPYHLPAPITDVEDALEPFWDGGQELVRRAAWLTSDQDRLLAAFTHAFRSAAAGPRRAGDLERFERAIAEVVAGRLWTRGSTHRSVGHAVERALRQLLDARTDYDRNTHVLVAHALADVERDPAAAAGSPSRPRDDRRLLAQPAEVTLHGDGRVSLDGRDARGWLRSRERADPAQVEAALRVRRDLAELIRSSSLCRAR
jgi:hypothetical protein